MEFGILVRFEGEDNREGLLLHFTEEPTMAELASRVQSSVVNYGQPYTWHVHEVNRSTMDAAEWRQRMG